MRLISVGRRSSVGGLSALMMALLVSGMGQAATGYSGDGHMSVTQVGSAVTTGFNPTTNSSHNAMCGPNNDQPQWFVGDTFTFTDNWTIDNSAGSVALTAAFHLELYQWIHGTPGTKLADQVVNPTVVGVGNTVTGTLIVTGTYNGWNGSPGCEVSFHVYRHAGSPNANNPNSNYY